MRRHEPTRARRFPICKITMWKDQQLQMVHDAKVLGLWAIYHKHHFHGQGLPIGPVPEGWEP